MKKHNMMRVASALAVVTLLSTSVISGTLAKYTSEKESNTDTTTVAKWEIKAGTNGNLKSISSTTETESFTFNLFDTVKDDDVVKELQELDISNMTPMDAMNTLYRLQNKLKNRW